MRNSQTVHCRLCAELKCNDKLMNLETDEHKRCSTLEKLSRLGIFVSNLDSRDDSLPKTVCFVCLELLDKCFMFVSSVEAAQIVLDEYLSTQKVKEEVPDDYDSQEERFDEQFEAEDVKTELQTEDVPKVSTKIQKKKRLNNSLDMLPLSQLKLSWKDYSWKCAICDTLFPHVEELKSHSIKFHNCCNAFRCTDCNRRKFKLDSFIIHIKRHRKYLKLSCYKCHKEFSSLNNAHVHKSTHITSDYYCKGCNEMLSTQEELTKHTVTYNKDKRIRNIPDSLMEDLTCLQCQKTFKSKGSLKTHLLTHTERKRDHTCEKCGKCFFNKFNLAGHMMLHNDTRPYQCEICNNCFRTKSQLRAHIGVHNNSKPFSCEQCGRQFRLEKQLTSHSIIHTDSLPYECTICHKSFKFKTVLKQHLRQHTGAKPYSCQICGRDFTNWPNYNKHMKRRHSMDMAKKKHTPDGLFPINPVTGEVMMKPQTQKTLEWMKKVLEDPRRTKVKSKNVRTKLLNAGEGKS